MFRGPKDHGGKREEASCTEVFSVVTRMRWIPTLLDVWHAAMGWFEERV